MTAARRSGISGAAIGPPAARTAIAGIAAATRLPAACAALAAMLLLTACGPRLVDAGRPLEVSVIGARPRLADPDRGAPDAPSAALLGAVAQGLVRFDAAGQIEAGLAIRWDVSNDGLYYTFRLADGGGIDAEAAARRLRAAITPASRNPLAPVLGAVSEVVAVTPQVIELRLVAPRPDFLQLLAQPALAIAARGHGTGPLAIADARGDALLLGPIQPPDTDPITPAERRAHEVRLRGERAALAVARFAAGQAAVVTGGTFADVAIPLTAQLAPRALHIDPAAGLFGIQIARSDGFLGPPEHRDALAMAVDRDRITAAFAVPGGWRPALTIVPRDTNEITAPAPFAWTSLDMATRTAQARATVAAWRAANPAAAAPVLRLALPAGPGARLLFTLLMLDWRAIGVTLEAVPAATRDADLRLVDQVAPGNSASWYLRRFECVRSRPCSDLADQALTAARTAPVIAERARLLSEADRRLTELIPFIPIAQPLRWSLVAPGVDAWRDNALAIHPLAHLRD